MEQTHDNQEVRHEESDVNVRAIFAFCAGLVAVGIAVHFAVWLMFQYLTGREAARAPIAYPLAAGQNRVPPEPRLQTNPREDLRAVRAREDEILTTYARVDKNSGVVRVPIDEAMRITLKRGLPARQVSETKK